MELDSKVGDADTQEVATRSPDPGGETPHPDTLCVVDGIDRIGPPGRGADLHCDQCAGIVRQEIDLTIRECHVGLDDLQPVGGQKPCGQPLPRGAEAPSPVVQMGSSDFSNSSTLTSRKVRTWT